jgi:hypothetical protein
MLTTIGGSSFHLTDVKCICQNNFVVQCITQILFIRTIRIRCHHFVSYFMLLYDTSAETIINSQEILQTVLHLMWVRSFSQYPGSLSYLILSYLSHSSFVSKIIISVSQLFLLNINLSPGNHCPKLCFVLQLYEA